MTSAARTLPVDGPRASPVRPMDDEQAGRLAQLLKALAYPARLRLLSLVMSYEGQEACVCELLPAMGLSQPTVSHHLKVLHDAGLLEREKRGSWVYYRVPSGALAPLASVLRIPAVRP